MSLRTYLIVGLALVFGITSAMGINVFLKTRSANVERETVQIAAAGDKGHARSVPLGQYDIKWVHVPKDAIPPGALLATEDVVDRLPRIDIAKGEYILDNMLTKKGAKSIAASIPAGMTAVSVENSFVPSNVQPGDRVDVMLNYKPTKLEKPNTVTILTMVRVWSVNGATEPVLGAKNDGKQPKSLDVLLTPEQAKDLAVGRNQGTIQLTLRNATDPPSEVTKLADLKIEVAQDDGDAPSVSLIRILKGTDSNSFSIQGGRMVAQP